MSLTHIIQCKICSATMGGKEMQKVNSIQSRHCIPLVSNITIACKERARCFLVCYEDTRREVCESPQQPR